MVQLEHIAQGYFFAKNYIIKKGFADEIDWQDLIELQNLTEVEFIAQYTWVVLASGINDKVVRKIFPRIKKALKGFSSQSVVHNQEKCFLECLSILNHPGKVNAIINTIISINKNKFKSIKSRIESEGINYIQSLPYMGKATSYHLAKNIGLNVAKPDRHLVRIISLIGYSDVNVFCQELSITIEEKVSLIDLVLWRYATLDKNYERNISWFVSKHSFRNRMAF